jgi:hypothetical protein
MAMAKTSTIKLPKRFEVLRGLYEMAPCGTCTCRYVNGVLQCEPHCRHPCDCPTEIFASLKEAARDGEPFEILCVNPENSNPIINFLLEQYLILARRAQLLLRLLIGAVIGLAALSGVLAWALLRR